MKKIVSYFIRLAFVIIIVFLCYGWWVSSQAHYYQTELGPELRERYGVATGTPYLSFGDESREVLTVHPVPGGAFDAAGFKQGDIVLSTTLTTFYRTLSASEGEVIFRVVAGGDGEAIELRPVRQLKLGLIE